MGDRDVMTDPATETTAETTDAPEATAEMNATAASPPDDSAAAELGDTPVDRPEIETPPERPEVETTGHAARATHGAARRSACGDARPTRPSSDRSSPRASRPASPMEAPGAPGDQSPMQAQASEPQQGPRTVGRLIADALRSAGVRYAFTVPGESFLGLLDALGDAGIRVVATRHEGAAAFMAEAHGQLTGRPAACLGTRAVGSANLAIGIHTARQDSTAMFAIVGQVERGHRGHEAFQEIDQVATIGGLAKWAAEPQRARRCRAGDGRGHPPGPRWSPRPRPAVAR